LPGRGGHRSSLRPVKGPRGLSLRPAKVPGALWWMLHRGTALCLSQPHRISRMETATRDVGDDDGFSDGDVNGEAADEDTYSMRKDRSQIVIRGNSWPLLDGEKWPHTYFRPLGVAPCRLAVALVSIPVQWSRVGLRAAEKTLVAVPSHPLK
jgi:hypothetical protein